MSDDTMARLFHWVRKTIRDEYVGTLGTFDDDIAAWEREHPEVLARVLPLDNCYCSACEVLRAARRGDVKSQSLRDQWAQERERNRPLPTPPGLELCAVFRGRVVNVIDRGERKFRASATGEIGSGEWFMFDDWTKEQGVPT